MFAWALGTGFTVLGIVLVGIVAFIDHEEVRTQQLALTTIVLGGITIAVGGFSSYVAAQASSAPIRNLREAYGRVEEGDFEKVEILARSNQVNGRLDGSQLPPEGYEASASYPDGYVLEQLGPPGLTPPRDALTEPTGGG